MDTNLLKNATAHQSFYAMNKTREDRHNDEGTTSVHVFFCIFFTVLTAIFLSISKTRTSTFNQYINEYVLLVLPMILAHTVLAEYILCINVSVFIIFLYQVLYFRKNALKKFQTKNVFKNNRLKLVTSLRGLTYIITGLCILAVDFVHFPLYLAKTVTIGYSLMDTGVGLFIAMSGIVHKDISNSSLKDIIKGNVKIVTILVLLGVGRFVTIKLFGLPEVVTEYGVHWNFFFTIAVCKVISTLLLCISNEALLLSVITLIVHEFILFVALEAWVFGTSPRSNLLSANREGISSCLGFVSIYLFSVHMKQLLLNKNATKYATLKKLVCGSVLLWVLSYWHLVCPTSRVLANASYCLFTNAILITITCVKYFVMTLCEEQNVQIPLILSTINSNGLTYFLISNLLTGAVNLTIDALSMNGIVAFIILNLYMITSITLVTYVEKLGFRI